MSGDLNHVRFVSETEYTQSHLICKAKQGWAWLVFGWETTWEYQVL